MKRWILKQPMVLGRTNRPGLIAAGTIARLQGNQVRRQAASLVDHARGGAGARFIRPVAPVDDGGGLVALAVGEPLLLAAAGPPEDGTEQFAGGYRDQAEFPLHLL